MSESRFTLEDVARNNGASNARTWIVIKDVVYDVTDYLSEHPGGGALLMEYAGKDGTAAFDDFGHSSDAKNIMSSYRIGQPAENDKTANKPKKSKINKSSKLTNDGPREPSRRSFLRVVCGGCV